MPKIVKTIFLIAGIFFVFACSSMLTPASSITGTADSGIAREETPGAASPLVTDSLTPSSAKEPIQFIDPKRYRVESTATVTNGGFTLTELKVYQPKPIAWEGQANIIMEEISPAGVQEGRDAESGSEMYYWHLSNTPGWGKALDLKYRFTFTAYEIRTAIDPNSIQPYDKRSPEYIRYTQPEPYIESGDPAILALAARVADGETNPYLLAKKIYEYIIANAHYRLVGKGLLGAKAMLDNGEGECGDFAALFIGMARAEGVPARSIVGYWAVSGTNQTHVWAEFYLEGIGWIPVDPTIGQSEPEKFGIQEYYFGNMDNQRVILSKGFNIRLTPPAPDGAIASLLQGPYWWYWGTDGDPRSVSLEQTAWIVTPN